MVMKYDVTLLLMEFVQYGIDDDVRYRFSDITSINMMIHKVICVPPI